MTRVFVLEDDTKAMEIVNFLKNNGCDVTHAATLDDTIYFLEDEPGLAAMDKLLFDIAVPGCVTEHLQGDPRTTPYMGKYAGLEYIADNYLHWPDFQWAVDRGKVAILTAHDSNMQNDFKQKLLESPGLSKVTIISKLANNVDELLLRFLHK